MKNCAFCDRKVFEERIITETDEFFVIATLGQITDGGHLLIFPKRHARCLTHLTTEEMEKFTNLLFQTERSVLREYCNAEIDNHSFSVGNILFEHGIVGQTVLHAHIHIVPASLYLTAYIQKDYREARHSRFNIFTDGVPRPHNAEFVSYLLWRSPGVREPTHIWWRPLEVPLQYFRTLVAKEYGRPERANWRTMDPVLDKRLCSETVLRLKKYF